MLRVFASRGALLASVLAALALSACGKKTPSADSNAFTAITPATHRSFPIVTGPHAVDCASCHGTYPSFKQFDCQGCHAQSPTAAVHTTTSGYAYQSQACFGCHADPTAHPFDHKNISLCAGCHDLGAAYAALPVAGFTHQATAGSDCSQCHAIASWRSLVLPTGLVADPAAAVQVNALVPRYSSTSIVGLSPQAESLPMWMNHATTEVDVAGLACSACHAGASAGALYPGRLHSSLANLKQPAPASCGGCHASSAPTGLVGPTAASPARSPPSGGMKHDAVAWSDGAPTGTRVVTADCGACHLSPTATLAATWRTGTAGASPARYHAALSAAGMAQPTSCLDCHANSRPVGVVSAPSGAMPPGLTFDHAGAGAMGDCATCHAAVAPAWSGGRYHLAGSADPASCLPCHDGQRPASDVGWISAGYAASPFDYGTNAAGITHGDGLDCAGCHGGPGTGGVQAFTGGHFTHGPATVSATTCIACHMSQRPDLVLGTAQAAAALGSFDHSVSGTGDCIGCHQATTRYVNYFSPGGSFPGGDWQGAFGASAPIGFFSDPAAAVAVNALIATYSGSSIVGLSAQVETLPMGMEHATAEVNMAGLACSACHASASAGVFYPGRLHSSLANLARPPPVACLDCHDTSVPTGFVGPIATSPARSPPSGEMKHDAVAWSGGVVTTTRVVTADCGACHLSPTALLPATWRTGTSGSSPARFHAALTAAGLPQPGSCVDCHANSRPAGAVSSLTASLPAGLSFDHAGAGGMGDCASCHFGTTAWSGGRFHLAGSATPASCLPCHAGQRPASAAGWISAGYAASPFDYGTSPAGITHGDGLDCAGCHGGPGTGGTWGGAQAFTGGHFTHGPATVSAATCIACHMSQRPDLVLGTAQAAAALGSFDHSVSGTGDCIGCHQATVAAGSFVNYYGPGGSFPGGDWQGAVAYPGNQLVSSLSQYLVVTEIALVRPPPGALVTGMTWTQATLYNAMLHTSDQVPAQLSPGPAGAPDPTTCWHCHVHDGAGTVTSFADGQFHAALAGYSATVGGAVMPLPQPTGQCVDCHGQTRPAGIVELASSDLQPMDHAARFTGTVTIAGRSVNGVAGLDCSTCHQTSSVAWTDGTFHAKIGAAVPADCTACHFPLMADAPSADVSSGAFYAMSHGSVQVTFQACATCHTSALTGSTATPYQSTAWSPGAYHASVPSQPTSCIDCHAVSEPAAYAPTQSTWNYALAAGWTDSNGGQWMNHGAGAVVGLDCVACHVADASATGSAWSQATQLHAAVSSPGTCQECHGLANGGGTVIGLHNNLPFGLTDSTTLTTAAADSSTGVPAGTHDQITHADVNVSGHDCAFCHTQVGRSTSGGIEGAEWAQASFHASFSAATPLLLDGSTGRCSNCHLNVKPGADFTAQDHATFTGAAGSQDCSACHSWPGTGGASAPDWLGASVVPQYISVGGFTIPQPPATVATRQAGITNLPHPNAATGMTCATCHAGGVGGKQAMGYDHASALINAACSACHEAGSNLVAASWNGATAQGSGAGDTRPFTLTSIVAHQGGPGGNPCTVTAPNHFYAVQCGQCHAVPAGTGAVTTGTAYVTAWRFPHTESKMTNPGTCNLCHTSPACPK